MSDEKIQSIQEKIHTERLKIQEKFSKNQEIPQKIEEIPQKCEIFTPKNIEEAKKLIKESVIDRDFDQRAFSENDNYHSPGSGAIMGGVMVMIVGFQY